MARATVRGAKKLEIDPVTIPAFLSVPVLPNLISCLHVSHVVRGGEILVNVTGSTVVTDDSVVLGSKKVAAQRPLEGIPRAGGQTEQ